MIKKEYPKIIAMRKSIIGAVIIGALIVVMLILWNIYHATHKKHMPTKISSQSKAVTTNNSEMLWYKDIANQNVKTVNSEEAKKQSQVVEESLETSSSSTKESSSYLEDKEYKKAKTASITSNQINVNLNGANLSNSSGAEQKTDEVDYSNREADQNRQIEKMAFMKNNERLGDDLLHENLQASISPYEVKAGAIIPGILISGINSDLPGQIIAQVRSNVYDTVTGKYLLIPQGAKITGLYDSQIVYGQKRVLVIWKRIIFPNGKSINLEGMPGVDLSGYAGFSDQVNNHYLKMLGSVILLSVLSAGAELSSPQEFNDDGTLSVSETLASSLGTNIAEVGTAMINKDMNIQPTLEIRPGYLFNISVTKDIVFPGSYGET